MPLIELTSLKTTSYHLEPLVWLKYWPIYWLSSPGTYYH